MGVSSPAISVNPVPILDKEKEIPLPEVSDLTLSTGQTGRTSHETN